MSQTQLRYTVDFLMRSVDEGVIANAILDIEGGAVLWSGLAIDAPPSDSSIVHLEGLVMPGFINAHAHTPMLLLRGTGEGLPTTKWLTDVMWPREGRLVEDDVSWAMRLGASELLLNGITTTNEMYFFGNAVAESAVAVGLRCIVSAPLIESSMFSRFGSAKDQLANINSMRIQWSNHHLIEVGVGPHAAYSLSRQTLTTLSEFLSADPMLVHTHIAEQPHEADEILSTTGLTVPEYLDEIGLLTDRTIAAHCVWLTESDVQLFAERGVSVAHCPVSNGRHASGIAPLKELLSAGVKVGIGTDGPASHDRLDMFDEMRCVMRYARIREMNASQISPAEVLYMATRGSALALGRTDIGQLTAGMRADFVRVDVGSPGFDPVFEYSSLMDRYVWVGSPSIIQDVWVDGDCVVKDGVCVTIDRVEARKMTMQCARRLVQE